MAGDCTYNRLQRYGAAETFRPPPLPLPPSSSVRGDHDPAVGGGSLKTKGRRPPSSSPPHFEVIDGLLYRKKLERGFLNYREVLAEERRHEAVSAFHRRRAGGHLSFEETYKCVAENYWWDGKGGRGGGDPLAPPAVRCVCVCVGGGGGGCVCVCVCGMQFLRSDITLLLVVGL